MALKNFIKNGSYTKIIKIWIEPEKEIVGFTVVVRDSKTGNGLVDQINYTISRQLDELDMFEKISPKNDKENNFEENLEKARSDAKSNNCFVKFFSNEKIYVDSNLVAQAYNYLKNLPAFEGVEDV